MIKMNIAVIGGAGYVGFTTAACLAYKGHKVYCVDKDIGKVNRINQGFPVIYEPGLEEILKVVGGKDRLSASCDETSSISNSSVIFVCAGTPSREDGSIDLRQITNVAEVVGKSLLKKDEYCTVTIKSTVVPGTTQSIVIPLLEKYSRKKAGVDFGVCMNPEFLREGSAVKDFLCPKAQGIVIGELDPKSGDALIELYKDFDSEILRTEICTAEMIKYARNAYLAKDISFANEIANICQRLNINYSDVKRGMAMDSRIGEGRFLNAGIGFGGSCFSKDVKALATKAREVGVLPKMLEVTLEINEDQPAVLVSLIKKNMGQLKDKNIAVLGLSFKPGTDDMREARSIPIIEQLLTEGAHICAFDPHAMIRARSFFGDKIHYANSAVDALRQAEACVIVTEWPMFSDPELYENLQGVFIFDGRRLLDPKKLSNRFVYVAIGYPEVEKS